MNFEWILLALLLVTIITEVAKAITKPMLKNFLRLICVPVAFLITFIIQALGLFQLATTKLVEKVVPMVVPMITGNLPVPIPEELLTSTMEGSAVFISAILSPTLFMITFSILLFLLRTVHVNLVLRYIRSKAMKKEKKELIAAIKAEKTLVKEIIKEGDEQLQDAIDAALEANDNETLREILERANLLPDEDKLEDMAEKRVKKEKRRKKRKGYFKESSEKKAISLVCGAVSAFLLFAISMMPVFYGMEVLSYITDGIEDTNADDTRVYQVVEVIDKHVVKPYEESFVIQLYDSMALVDLMNDTVRMGGKMVLEDGQVVYLDSVLQNLLTHSVSAVAQYTSGKSDQKNMIDDIEAILTDPVIVDTLAEVIRMALYAVETPAVPEEGNPAAGMTGNIIVYYKNADIAVIKNDINAVTDTIIVVIENNMISDITAIMAGEMDPMSLLEDRELLLDLLNSASGISMYPTLMDTLMKKGVDMLVPSLGLSAETAQEMKDAIKFEDWDEESRKSDNEKLLQIIDGLLEIMKTLGESGGSEGSDDPNAATEALLDQFVAIGKMMDIMSDTTCLADLPPILLEGLVTNDMLSGLVTPELVEQINTTVRENPDLSYEKYMKSLAALLKMALSNMPKQ